MGGWINLMKNALGSLVTQGIGQLLFPRQHGNKNYFFVGKICIFCWYLNRKLGSIKAGKLAVYIVRYEVTLFFLSGRLGQIGLKEGYLAAVKNISSVIGLFVQHAKEEGNVFFRETWV